MERPITTARPVDKGCTMALMKASAILVCLALALSASAAEQNPLMNAGIPLYPKAVKISIDFGKKAKNGSKTVQAEYSSTDSPTKVVDFYQEHLGMQEASPTPHFHQLVGKLPKGGMLQMYISANGAKTKLQYFFILPAKS